MYMYQVILTRLGFLRRQSPTQIDKYTDSVALHDSINLCSVWAGFAAIFWQKLLYLLDSSSQKNKTNLLPSFSSIGFSIGWTSICSISDYTIKKVQGEKFIRQRKQSGESKTNVYLGEMLLTIRGVLPSREVFRTEKAVPCRQWTRGAKTWRKLGDFIALHWPPNVLHDYPRYRTSAKIMCVESS